MDIEKHKKQTTDNIVNDIHSKLNKIKSKNEQTHSTFFNDLSFITNKDLISNFRKGNDKFDRPISSIHNIFESNRPFLSTISKDEQVTNKLNHFRRHCSQDNNNSRHTLNNHNNQSQSKANVINSKKAEIIQSLIPKCNIYSYRNK